MKKNVTLLDSINNIRFSNLPEDLVLYVKHHILDAIGDAVAGAKTQAGHRFIKEAKMQRGNGESTVITDGARLTAPVAYRVNSKLCRLFRFDDLIYTLPSHPGRSIIHASLSAGEKQDVQLKDAITTILSISELILQLGRVISDIAWPLDKPHPDPALDFCFTLPGLAALAKGLLEEQRQEKEGYDFASLVIETLSLLEEPYIKDNSISINIELIRKVGESLNPIESTKSAWRKCLTRKVGLRLSLFDHFTNTPIKVLTRAIGREQVQPENIENILLKGLHWMKLLKFKDQLIEEAIHRIASTAFLYMDGIYPGDSWYLNGRLNNRQIAELAGKIMFVEDFEDYWEAINSTTYQYSYMAQINIINKRPKIGRLKYIISDIENLRTRQQFRNRFQDNVLDIMGKRQEGELYDRIIGQENIGVPELMKLTRPRFWDAHLLRKLGVLVDNIS